MRLHRRLSPFIAFLLAAIPFSAQSKDVKSKLRLDPDKQIKIKYNSPSWNTDPEKIDSAFLIFRDSVTGRMVEIQLEETAPDSSDFIGIFAITWANSSQISPEIYIPPQELRGHDQGKLFQMVSAGKIQRKPIIVRKLSTEQKEIDVYDDRSEAEVAWKAYQEELRISKRGLIKPVPSQQNLDAAQMAEHQKELKDLAQAAASHETERSQLEQTERLKLKKLQDRFKALSESEQKKRQEKAKGLFAEGMKSYQAGAYADAESKFRSAIDTNPMETSYYFNDGVTLYRLERLNDAMVAIRIANDDPKTAVEKKYYMGLIHLKLKELAPAAQLFDEVGQSGDPVLGPSGLFYKGVLLFTDAKFDESKPVFEKVIDVSQDPELDKQAEDYLDRIAQAIAFQKAREKKWIVSGLIGAFYDSNVLLAPDNQTAQGQVLKTGDFRLLTMGSAEYRPIFTEHNELSVKGTFNLTNSSKDEVTVADPWIYTLETPYSYKGVLWGKGYKFTVRPGYQMLYMSLAEGTSKKDIMNSPYIAIDNTFVMHANWYSTYTLQFERDNAGIPYTTINDDYTADQYYLKTSQTFLLDRSKQEALIANGGVARNLAVGDQRTYTRYEIGTIYARPIGSYSWNIGLSYYYLNYPSASRIDNNMSFSTGISKPFTEWFTWGVNGTYTDNASTQSTTYAYDKFVIMTTLAFNGMF